MSPEQLAEVVVTTIKKSIAPLAARLDAIESRAPVPGPQGPAGIDGKDGAPGKDGASIEDVAIEFDGDRTLAFRITRAGEVRTTPIRLPYLKYCGVYAEGFPYVPGDVVTANGNAWHCQKATTLKPGQDVNAWRLMVRKGRDARQPVER